MPELRPSAVRPHNPHAAFALVYLLLNAPAGLAAQSAPSAAGHSSPALQSPSKSVSATKTIPPPESRVDINHASTDELLKVPGITATWAGRIVRYRPYRTKQDLLDRGVLPSDVYDRIKDYVIAHRDKQ